MSFSAILHKVKPSEVLLYLNKSKRVYEILSGQLNSWMMFSQLKLKSCSSWVRSVSAPGPVRPRSAMFSSSPDLQFKICMLFWLQTQTWHKCGIHGRQLSVTTAICVSAHGNRRAVRTWSSGSCAICSPWLQVKLQQRGCCVWTSFLLPATPCSLQNGWKA